MANARLVELAKRLRELKDRKEEITAELKLVDEELKDIQINKLPEMMSENDVEKFTVEGCGSIHTEVKVYAYVKKEDEAKFHDWLRSEGHGDLVKAYVFPGTLSSFAREQIENGCDIPDFLKATKVPTAILRRK